MEQILPVEAYRETIEALPVARLGVLTGTLFGAIFLVTWAGLFTFGVPGRSPSWPLLVACTAGGALLFGVMFPRSMRRRLLQVTEELCANRGRYATTAPSGSYTHRLACSLRSGRLEVGGALYLGAKVATFVPHVGNLPRHRRVVPITDGVPCAVRLRSRPAPLVGWGPSYLVEVSSSAGSWLFNTPRPAHVVAELRNLLAVGAGDSSSQLTPPPAPSPPE
jgi:hypothetical protein